MATSYLLGRKAVAYFNNNESLLGDIGAGTTPDEWIADWLGDANTQVAANMVDVGLNIGSDYADATTRATAASGFASNVPVLRNGEVTFEARWLPDDPAAATKSFTKVLLNAWETDGRIAMVFFDQPYQVPVAGQIIVQGLASNWSVSMEKTENLRDVQRMSVTLTVADSAAWYSETLGT